MAAYVDDLLIALKDPQSLANTLTNKYEFKLKGTGPISYHLGCDLVRHEKGTLCFVPRKNAEKIYMCFNKFPARVIEYAVENEVRCSILALTPIILNGCKSTNSYPPGDYVFIEKAYQT